VTLLKEYPHRSFIALNEVFESNHYIYLVLEYLKDDHLFTQLKKHIHYTEADARKIMKSLLEAIEHLHRNQIVHRDLKPLNILL
jgi:serine/threonine protein kinase